MTARAAPDFTVYVLGAGASHEGGVPLAGQILPVGYRLLRALRSRRKSGGDGAYLARLSKDHARSFARVYDFIARVFQGRPGLREIDMDNLPSLDELWALLEIAYGSRATFGLKDAPHDTARVRNALMGLMYHVLVGCVVEYGDDGDYTVHYRGCPNPYARFIRRLGPHDAIIALNYDTLLDRALAAAGRAIDYGTDVSSRRTPRARTVPVLKLHGSFNWLWCPTCNTVQDYGARNVAHIPLEPGRPDAYCPNDGALREHIIIPPSLIKSYGNLHVQRIWATAAHVLRECSRVVFVGYAMSDADIQVRYLVKQATSTNARLEHAARPITVVNASPDVVNGYARLFGAERVQIAAKSFGEYLAQSK